MENRINWLEYEAIIASSAKKYAQTHMYNSRIIDEDDLKQEGHLLLSRCVHTFEKELFEYDMQVMAFRRYFKRALYYKYMSLNFKVQRHHRNDSFERLCMTHAVPVELAIEFADEIQHELGEMGSRYLQLCLDTPEDVQKTVVKKESTFRKETERVLQISGRHRASLNKRLETCIFD